MAQTSSKTFKDDEIINSNNIKIINVYDNDSCESSNLKSLWGFSCFIQTPNKNILFDTGGNGRVLLQNLQKKNIDVQSIDILFISHSHWDHTGGIDSILELNSNIDVFVTKSLSSYFMNDLKSMCKSMSIIEKEPTKLYEDIYSSGTLSAILEQSLILDTNEGAIVLAGCAHGKIEEIAKIAKTLLGKDILLLMGGFHLHKDMQRLHKVVKAIKDLNVKYIAPSHCTGEEAKIILSKEFKDEYINSSLGIEIEF